MMIKNKSLLELIKAE